MTRRRPALLPLVLAAALAAGCQPAPTRATLRVAGASQAGLATLHVRVPARYALRYLGTTDWDEAVATLKQGATTIDTQTVAVARTDADGARTATFAFTGITPGAGFELDVRFKRYDAAGALVEVGWSQSAAPMDLVAGANTFTLPAATFSSDATATPGEPEGLVSTYVASWPAAGPGGRLGQPQDAVSDGNGTTYMSDADRDAILALDADGVITVIAGDGVAGFADGDGATARFKDPRGLLLVGDQLYVADTGNHRIRQIDLGTEGFPVTTLAGDGTAGHQDGAGDVAWFQGPTAITGGATGTFYVADRDNNRIRRIKVGDGVVVSTFAGTGAAGLANAAAANAIFDHPEGIALGNGALYVADTANFLIRKIAIVGLENDPGDVTTHAGTGFTGYVDGDANVAKFTAPTDVAYDPVTTLLYVADSTSHRVRGVATANPTNQVWTYAGTSSSGWKDGVAANGLLVEPFGVSYGATGLTIADRDGARVRFVSQAADLSTVAGDGIRGVLPGDSLTAQRPQPAGVALGLDDVPIVTDTTADRLWRVPATGAATVLAGTGTAGYFDGAAGVAQFRDPKGIVRRADGSYLVADANNHSIRRVLTDGTTSTWAGNGTIGDADGDATTSRFRTPWGLAIAPDGAVWVTETCGRVRRITEGVGGALTVTTIAGANAIDWVDGVGTAARFNEPRGIDVDAEGDVYVVDAFNHRIRKIAETAPGVWTVSTFAGDGQEAHADGAAAVASFDDPRDLALAADGSIWVADSDNHRVRRIAFGNDGWVVSTVAGSGATEYADGPGPAAGIRDPYALVFAADGTLFVADHDGGGLRTIKY